MGLDSKEPTILNKGTLVIYEHILRDIEMSVKTDFTVLVGLMYVE